MPLILPLSVLARSESKTATASNAAAIARATSASSEDTAAVFRLLDCVWGECPADLRVRIVSAAGFKESAASTDRAPNFVALREEVQILRKRTGDRHLEIGWIGIDRIGTVRFEEGADLFLSIDVVAPFTTSRLTRNLVAMIQFDFASCDGKLRSVSRLLRDAKGKVPWCP